MCPDEETLLGYFRGTLEATARAAVELHLADCDECRVLVSVLARASVSEGALAATVAPATPPLGSAHDLAVAETDVASAPKASGAPRAPVAPGEVLGGKYRVDAVLGAGGMGVVVRATHLELARPVALKFLLPSACEAPGAIDRFLREGRAAARLESEHVARVLETGTHAGAPFLVMEYLEGSDLADVLAARERLPVSEAVDYVLQACDAIGEAHAAGIVHRDLKPSNLFLARRADGTARVKVLDFGISKAEGGSRPDLTASSMMMGSPRYMSPEQMVSARDADARADIWALGVVLFELVTGRPVWEADTVQGLCALVATAPAPRLRAFAPEASEALEALVLSCLEKDPARRPQSIAELARGLAPLRALGSAAPTPYVSSALPSPPSAAPAAGQRAVVALAAIIALALAAGGVLLWFGARDATPSAAPRPVVSAEGTARGAPPASAAIAGAPAAAPASVAPSATATHAQGSEQATVARTTTPPPRPPPRSRPPPAPEKPVASAPAAARTAAPPTPSNRALSDRK